MATRVYSGRMNRLRHVVVAVSAAATFLVAGCSSAEPPAPETQQSVSSESAPARSGSEASPSFAGLEQLADTEWTGLDHLRDQITFIFHADGRVSYRNEQGEYSYDGDTWSVNGGLVVFQADYRGPFGVATHTGRFDDEAGALLVEYTTTTNRTGSYTLYLLD